MPERSRSETQAFLKLARERFKQGQDAIDKQRQRELADLAFYAGGEHQWDPEAIKRRKGYEAQGSMPAVPARPTITINKVREPVHQVLNQERQSDMGIELVPADDWGELAPSISDEEIELREGLVRRIQRESEAADARTWAFMRAVIAGVGYYRINTRYAEGKTWDQDIYVDRIYNQASVTLDPTHQEPDGSDCEWEFQGGDLSWDRYKAEHSSAAKGEPNRVAQADDAEFRALGEEYPGWFKAEGETRSARVVEYFYTERETRTLVRLATGESVWKDELPEDFDAKQIDGERPVVTKKIKWAKIDAVQVLEETDWPSPCMPIVKVLGEELQPFDGAGDHRAEGMVRPARGAQEGFNAMISKLVETIGYAPIPPLQIGESNIAAYGTWYQLLSTRALPFVPYVEFDAQGRPLQPPSRSAQDTPIQPMAVAIQMFDEGIKSTTMVPAVQLGQATDRQLKAKGAIESLISQGQLGTSHFLDNLKRSVRYEGEIENSLLYPIYGLRPGRLVRMLTGENEPQAVRIGVPNGMQPQPMGNGGIPGQTPGMPAAPPVTSPLSMMRQQPQAPQKSPKTYTLTPNANFNVLVKVSRSFDSRATEEATTIGQLLQAEPMYMTWFGDLFFKNQDGPGHEEMAERAEVMLDPKIQALRQQKGQGQPVPPQMQAQMAQLQQRLQQAEQILGQAKQELESKAQEGQIKLQIEREKMQHAEKLQAMKDATAIRVAELGAKKDLISETYEDREEALALAQQQAHEADQAALDRQHERNQAQLAQQHAVEQQAMQPPPQAPAGG